MRSGNAFSGRLPKALSISIDKYWAKICIIFSGTKDFLGRICGDSSVCPGRRNHMPNNNQGKSNRGFASMDEDKQREAASRGGQQSGGNFANDQERASEAAKKGGQMSSGNFANDPERASEAGRKGGHQSGGNRDQQQRADQSGQNRQQG
jgi:general stress protein YciG